MYFKVKVNRTIVTKNNKYKEIQETYLTESQDFIEAGTKIIEELGKEIEVEDICIMKSLKPSANEYINDSKIFIVKIAEDIFVDGFIKTLKYSLPVFAFTSDEVYKVIKDYMKQGFEDMRITTISETKWIWI